MSFRLPPAGHVSIPGPAGVLEARVEAPHDALPGRFGVICHPHPLHGGTLDNKVVHTLARAFQQLGLPTIRFNFRGVGGSAGRHDDGRGETGDAVAAVDWGRARWPLAEPWLAGFSFGAAVAMRAAAAVSAAKLVTVSPPVGHAAAQDLPAVSCPWLIVQGDADEVVDCSAVLGWARTLDQHPTVRVLAGAGHFFHGRLHELRELVAGWAAEKEKPGEG